jgi:hypothetical protein
LTGEIVNTEAILLQIDAEIERLTKARALLSTSLNGNAQAEKAKLKTGKRTMSPEGRARVATAQRARWAKVKKAAK